MVLGVQQPIPGVTYMPESRLQYYVEQNALPTISLVEALQKSFVKNAYRTAISTVDSDISYAELDEQTNRLAAGLLGLGLEPLDRVLFQSANCVELIVAILGSFKAGLIPVCTLNAHREREMVYLGNHASAKAHIIQGADAKFDFAEFALRIQQDVPSLQHIISLHDQQVAGVVGMQSLINRNDADEAGRVVGGIARDPFQVAIFQLSGGTTGVPKIIPRMQNDYLLNARLTAEHLGYRAEDVLFMPMPIIHNACMMCFLLPGLLSGSCFALPRAMNAEAWGEIFRKARPSWAGLIRALLPRFNEMLERGFATTDSLRAIWSPDGARLMRQKFGKQAYGLFGMAEGMNMYTAAVDPQEVQDAFVGRPLSAFDEVKLVEPGTENEAPVGEIGELICRGPYTLVGYFDAEERNREAFTADGFYRTGDLMIQREFDGKVYYAFSGRSKDLVNRGFEKINCEEVESVVATHPMVSDCAVVGMPDPVLGERSCIYIVLKPGQQAPSVNDLGAFLERAGMAKFKWPERIETIESLPLTKVGKLDKATLRARIAGQLAREGVEIDD